MFDTKLSQIARTFLWLFSQTSGLVYSPLNSATLNCSSEVTLLALQHWHTKYTMSILVKVFIWHVCLHQLACAREMHSVAQNICNLHAHLTFAVTYSPIHGLRTPNSRVSNIESDDSQNVGLEDYNNISDGMFPHFTTPSIEITLGQKELENSFKF